MKHLLLLALAILSSHLLCAQLQGTQNELAPKIAPFYLTIGGGFNHTGLLSIGVEVPVIDNVSIFADVGVGGWGFKLGIGASYYFNYVNEGSAINLAYYYASGIRGTSVDIIVNNQAAIPIIIKPTGTLNLTYAYHFKLGRKSKFALYGGYAFALSEIENTYNVVDINQSFDDIERRAVELLHPNGIIVGWKFLIGLGNAQ